MTKEKLRKIGRRIITFALAASMALSFVLPVELGDISLDWGVIEASAEASVGDGNLTALDVSQGSITITDMSVSGKDGSGTEVTTVDPDGYIITGTTTENTITVSGTQNIVLNGVNIDVSGKNYTCAFKIEDNNTGTVTVTLADDSVNTLKSGYNCAGLQKNGVGAGIGKLIIKGGANGTGKLTATSGYYGAGIGSGYSAGASDITISGGIVTATGFIYGPGIGSGEGGSASDITISGGTVTAKGGTQGAGIGCSKGGSASDITISGGTVTATGGSRGAGIGGGYSAGASDITISGGTVTATGGYYGAGIGGGYSAGASDITISGGIVTAEGGIDAAGIGGGSGGSGTNITISGGSVKAVGYPNANDIGGGNGKSAVAPTLADGTTKVFLSQIDTAGVSSVIIDGVEYPTTHNGEAKIYPYFSEGFHTIVIDGSPEEVIYMRNDGSLTQPYLAQTVGDFVVYGGTLDTDYSYSGNVLTINGVTPLMIKNTDPNAATTDKIEVESGISANLTLAGVNINVSGTSDACAFKIADDSTGTVTITLASGTENKLISGINCAGLQKNGASGYLEIKGTGELTAQGGINAAGIGGGQSGSTAGITISGGIVTATSSMYGAGIGGGDGGSATDITISGGTVTATGGMYGAGIGGGRGGSGTDINISGGTVTATGKSGGAGIGGGSGGSGTDINISGGIVTATVDYYGAGIGGGDGGNGTDINISGGIVTATCVSGGAGIGGGAFGEGSDIIISGGSVLAQGGIFDQYSGAAIGNGIEAVDLENNVLSDGTYKTPTNGTENVYPLVVDNPSELSVKVDGTPYFPTYHGDGKLYLYLTAESHEIIVGEEVINVFWDSLIERLLKEDELGTDLTVTLTDGTGDPVYGVDYSYLKSEGVLTILSDTAMTIAKRAGVESTDDTIVIAADINADITLAGVNIDVSGTDNASAFKIADGSQGNVTVTLADDTVNTLTSGKNCAGLQKNGVYISADKGKLTIRGGANGTGTLTANGGSYGAGIGGGNGGSGANIEISGVKVTAAGGGSGAGIGGGSDGDGTNITISGGSVVEASNTYMGAGIGGGKGGSGTYITISGSKVTATGGADGGAGIGGGNGGSGTNIDISDSTVIAVSGSVTVYYEYGAGIGGGNGGNGTNITVSGGTVTAKGNNKSAGIGGGFNGDSSDVIISGGSVKAVGGVNASSFGSNGRPSAVPTNGAGTELFLLEIPNENGDSVYIDGNLYTPSDHTAADPSDKTLYAYVTGENHDVEINGVLTKYIFTSENGTFGKLGTNLVITPVNAGDTLVYGVDYEYSTAHFEHPNTLIIKTTKPVIISNATPGAVTSDKIFVADGYSANITLRDVNIDASDVANGCAFKIAENSAGNVTITLEGDNTLISGGYFAGLQKEGMDADVGKLLIKGDGSLIAENKGQGAGIGSGETIVGCRNIEIAGGKVTAKAGGSAAAIGSGLYGDTKDITISGGTVTVEGSNFGAGIGTGYYGGECSGIKITGGSLKITAADGQNTIGIGGNPAGAAVTPVNDEGENVYPFVVDNPNNQSVKVDDTSYTPTSHGDGKLYLYLTAGPHTIIVGEEVINVLWDPSTGKFLKEDELGADLTVTLTDGTGKPVYGVDYTYLKSEGVLTILSDTAMTIANRADVESTDNTIVIAADINAAITLAGVNIDVSATSGKCAFMIVDDSTGNVKITLADGKENTLISGFSCAGLQKNGASGSLEIGGTGKLYAQGGTGGAGIGGSRVSSSSNITISGGAVKAVGAVSGAGIGGGNGGSGSGITVSGGTVTATSSIGAGIGGGYNAIGENIVITGGSVNAGSSSGNLIGGGMNKSAVTPTLADGTTPVYLVVIPNPNGDKVLIDGVEYVPSNHSALDETNLYVYLPKKNASGNDHTIKVGDNEETTYVFDEDATDFLPVPKASDFIFTPPTGTVDGSVPYDGSEKTASVTANAGITGMGDVTVEYYDESGNKLDSPPKNVGTYKVKINVQKGQDYAAAADVEELTWEFTICPGTLTAGNFVFTAPADLVYNGRAKAATVTPTVATAGNIGAVTVKYFDKNGAEIISAPVNVGIYTVKIDVGAGSNYGAVTDLTAASWTFAITTGALTASDFSFAPPADLVYNGRAKAATVTPAVATAGNIGAVTVRYFDKNGAELASAPVNVGTYTVKIDVGAGSNYGAVTDLTAASWTFAITAGTLTASDFSFTPPADLVYDGRAKTATVTPSAAVADSIGAVTVKYFDKNGAELTSAPVNVGTYTVKINVGAGANYNAITDLTAASWTFAITTGALEAGDFTFAPPADLVYNGRAKTATVTPSAAVSDSIGAVTVRYFDKNGAELTSAPVNVGTYTVKINVEAGSNYAAVTDLTADTWTFAITTGALTASDFSFAPPADLAYDGAAKTAVVKTNDGIIGAGSVNVMYYKGNELLGSAPVVPGEYTVKISVGAGTNYAAATLLGDPQWKFTIGQGTLTAGGTGIASGTYGDKLSELAVSGLTAYVGNTEVAGSWRLVPDNDVVPSVGDNGAYTAQFTPSANASYYSNTLTVTGVTLNIAKADAAAVAPIGKTYNWGVRGGQSAAVTGLPTDMGALGEPVISVTGDSNVLAADSARYANGTVYFTLAENSAANIDETATINVTLKPQNYNDITFDVTVKIIDKNVQTATAECVLTLTVENDNTYTAVITAVEGAEYKFGSGEWSAVNTLTGIAHGTIVTGYIRIAETADYNAGAADSDEKTTGHGRLTYHQSNPADCENEGNYEYWTCDIHSEKTYYFSNEAGTTEITYEDTVTPANGHSLDKVERVEPTCTVDGNIEYYICSVCGKTFSDSEGENAVTEIVLGQTGHRWDTAYTADSDGHWHKCLNTGCTEIKDYSDHVSGGPATEETAETCEICGYELAPATGHLHINRLTFVDEVPESCTVNGVKAHYECSCGKLFSDENAENEVTLADLAIPAHHVPDATWSSDNDDNHYHLCTVCGEKVDITAHTYDGGKVTVEPTEETEGERTYTCTVCHHTKTEVIAKLDHTHKPSDGYSYDSTGHWKTCSDCDEKLEFAAHTYDGGIVTVEPTEETEGKSVYTCTVCGYAKTEVLPKLSHTHKPSDGYSYDSTGHWKTCSDCDEKLEFAAHTSDGGVVTTPATTGSSGLKTYSCTVCGYVIGTETIPAAANINDPPFCDDYNNAKLIITSTKVNLDKVTIRWKKISSAEKYIIYRYENEEWVEVFETEKSGVILGKMKNGKEYKLLVRYVVDGKLSPMKSSAEVTARAYYKPIVTATPLENKIRLDWEIVPGAEKYGIYRYVDGKAVKLAETYKHAVNVIGLSSDKEYKFIVRAYVNGEWTNMKESDIVTAKIV